MASIVWGRHPQEAYDNPYEYEAQEQFLREATALLDDLNIRLDRHTMEFHKNDVSLAKATWMLALDLVDSLLECAKLLGEKRHRAAARLFRDSVETIDLLRVLNSNTPRSAKALEQWYRNESIPHRESRKYLEETEGPEAAKRRRDFYDELSKFTHRTYRALADSYSLGQGDMMVHDSHSMSVLVLPQTIAAYLAVLADLIQQAAGCLSEVGALPEQEVTYAWLTSLETHTVPRRFAMN
ncbi:MAG: hypothetical protein FAZ92_04019 [Accumulibacter sp.]|uniref:hypothetical protein n=1 Tax=Accumulibacter sp. TaxID=2053492 RepID=UPI0011FD5A6D|nr:hypothetical protein [Accumulibacter sp.]TLD43700.1 MAG: hypothetical protein FAZ92_04019 [Accumulibacter sp.]